MSGYLKAYLIGAALIGMSLIDLQKSWRLELWGLEADAEIDGFFKQYGSKGKTSINVNFSFTTQSGMRMHAISAMIPELITAGSDTPRVVYLPNKPQVNHLKGTGYLGFYIMLIVGLMLIGGGWYFQRGNSPSETTGKS